MKEKRKGSIPVKRKQKEEGKFFISHEEITLSFDWINFWNFGKGILNKPFEIQPLEKVAPKWVVKGVALKVKPKGVLRGDPFI